MPGPPRRDARLRVDADCPWSDPQIRIDCVKRAPRLAHPSVLVDIGARACTWFDPKKGSAQLPNPVPKGPTVIVELLTDVRAR